MYNHASASDVHITVTESAQDYDNSTKVQMAHIYLYSKVIILLSLCTCKTQSCHYGPLIHKFSDECHMLNYNTVATKKGFYQLSLSLSSMTVTKG